MAVARSALGLAALAAALMAIQAAKREARRLGISLAELLRRSLRHMLPADESRPWMRYAGLIESGDPASSQRIDDMPFLDVRTVGAPDLQGAAAMLRRFADQDLTLADAVGLHLLRDGAIASGWSTDRRLGLTGTPLAIHLA